MMNSVHKKWLGDNQKALLGPLASRKTEAAFGVVGSEISRINSETQQQALNVDTPSWSTGIQQIDACLASGTLNRSGLHEVEPLRPTDLPSLTGFTFGLLARLRSSQPIIWCVTSEQVGEYGHLYAHGLQRFGVSPAQIIFSKVSKPIHLHFALEEAIKTDGVAAVIGEGPRPTFTGSRRLSLLTREHGRPCMLLSAGSSSGSRLNSNSSGERGSAALTRWQIAPCQGVEDPHDPFGPGLPTWRVALTRARGGTAMPSLSEAQSTNTNSYLNSYPNSYPNSCPNSYPWRIVWDDQTFSFHSASVFLNRTVSQADHAQGTNNKAMVG